MPKVASDIGLVAQAIGKIADVIAEFQKSAQVRQMKAAIEAGEKYIQTNRDSSLKPKKKKQLLAHYRKRFFKFN